jgi:hypothetical protein
MLARAVYRFRSWLARRALARDPIWREANDNQHKARKSHGRSKYHERIKQKRMHTALGWRG